MTDSHYAIVPSSTVQDSLQVRVYHFGIGAKHINTD